MKFESQSHAPTYIANARPGFGAADPQADYFCNQLPQNHLQVRLERAQPSLRVQKQHPVLYGPANSPRHCRNEKSGPRPDPDLSTAQDGSTRQRATWMDKDVEIGVLNQHNGSDVQRASDPVTG